MYVHCSDFKGLLHSSQLIYMRDWTQESLSNTVQHFFSENPLPMEIERFVDCVVPE